MNLCIAGGGKLWMVLNEQNSQKLRNHLAKISKTTCKGILKTKKNLNPPWKLTEWEIEYTFIIQEVNQMVITIGGSAHQILNNGFCLSK